MNISLSYRLDDNDYLQCYLFTASKSSGIKKQRRKARLLYALAFFLIGILFYSSHNRYEALYFLVFAVLVLLFYPLYQRYYYVKAYRKRIAAQTKGNAAELSSFTSTDNYVEAKDISGKTKIPLTEIENITETGLYFFIQLKVGGALIIPKLRLENREAVKNALIEICNAVKIPFQEELNWKWK